MKYKLKLFITGQTPASLKAIQNIKAICKEMLKKNQYEIEVVDVLKTPKLAEDEKIVATPTLVKKLPEPLQKIIGDLSDREKVLIGLDLIKKNKKED